MPFYHRLGNIPHKRHTVFKKRDGNIHFEQLFGTIGFDGMSSLLYHLHPPTMVNDILGQKDISPKIAIDKNPVLKSNLIIQQKYFETKKSLLMLYEYTLEELEAELNKTLE